MPENSILFTIWMTFIPFIFYSPQLLIEKAVRGKGKNKKISFFIMSTGILSKECHDVLLNSICDNYNAKKELF